MFGERCTLCGGKLDSRKICKECGLNNNKSEKNYKINRSQPPKAADEQRTYPGEKKKTAKQTYRKADTMPGGYRQKEEIPGQKSTTAKQNRQQKKAGWAAKLTTAIVIFSIAGTIIGSMGEMDINIPFFSGEEPDELNPYETLEQSGEELPEEGEYAEFELTSGRYIVGVHIPAGNYSAAMSYDYDAIQVNDREHFIYLYEYPAKEGTDYRDDLRLFEGALVEITAQESVVLTTENAQSVQSEENPLTQSYEFEGDIEKTAGVDFEPGVYDIHVSEGYGMVGIGVDDDEEYEEEFEEDDTVDDDAIEHIYVGAGSAKGMEYNNVIIPKGARLIMENESYDDENFNITLIPSPQIASTDYLQTYMDYYY